MLCLSDPFVLFTLLSLSILLELLCLAVWSLMPFNFVVSHLVLHGWIPKNWVLFLCSSEFDGLVLLRARCSILIKHKYHETKCHRCGLYESITQNKNSFAVPIQNKRKTTVYMPNTGVHIYIPRLRTFINSLQYNTILENRFNNFVFCFGARELH